LLKIYCLNPTSSHAIMVHVHTRTSNEPTRHRCARILGLSLSPRREGGREECMVPYQMSVVEGYWGETGVKIQFSPQNHPKNHPEIYPGKSGAWLGCVTVSQLSVIPREPPGSTPKKSCLNPTPILYEVGTQLKIPMRRGGMGLKLNNSAATGGRV
jgi:hypothetical protein